MVNVSLIHVLCNLVCQTDIFWCWNLFCKGFSTDVIICTYEYSYAFGAS